MKSTEEHCAFDLAHKDLNIKGYGVENSRRFHISDITAPMAHGWEEVCLKTVLVCLVEGLDEGGMISTV